MSYTVELHTKALEELNQSYQWYEARSEGLGKRFLTCVEKRINEIANYPERYPKKKAQFRETSIEIFPYIIIYEVLTKEQIVFISYIFHSKRNPRLKYKR